MYFKLCIWCVCGASHASHALSKTTLQLMEISGVAGLLPGAAGLPGCCRVVAGLGCRVAGARAQGVHGEARRHEGAVELHALQRPVGRAPAARLASFGSTTRSSRSASATTHPTRPLGAVPFQMACDGTRLAAGKKTAWSRAGFRQILNVTPPHTCPMFFTRVPR